MYNLILHTTTACNYNCTYCDVIKDNKIIPKENFGIILDFLQKNCSEINRLKFFGGEPLLNWKTIKFIIENSKNFLSGKYEIVTNTTLLRDEIWEYFEKYFGIIFFSIDSENNFDFEKVLNFITKYNLEKKLYFNLIIDPKNIEIAEIQFEKLYNSGMKWYNILPVYFTKIWEKDELEKFAKMMKKILDLSLKDKNLRLYWFYENSWENFSLINKSFFINTDLEVFFSDFPSTFLWQKIKKDLFLENLKNFNLKKILDSELTSEWQSFFEKYEKIISDFEKNIYTNVKWQKQLHKIMDYFALYLKNKK